MGQEFKYQAIVLGKRDVGETDRLYILYTQEKGKITIKGKGVRKPNAKLAGSLETLNFSEVFVSQGKGRGNITGVVPVTSFLNIRSREDIVFKVFFLLNIFERIIQPEEKEEKIFILLRDYFILLEKEASDIEIKKVDILNQEFIFKLLDYLGYRLEVNECVNCKSNLKLTKNYVSFSQGGIVCPSCFEKVKNVVNINNNVIKMLRIFLSNKLGSSLKLKITDRDSKNLKNIVEGFLGWIK